MLLADSRVETNVLQVPSQPGRQSEFHSEILHQKGTRMLAGHGTRAKQEWEQNGWREAFVGKWGQAEAAGTVGITIYSITKRTIKKVLRKWLDQ